MDFALDAIDTQRGSNEGAHLTVLGLDGLPYLNTKGEKHTLHLAGPDSAVYSRSMHAQTQRRIEAAAAAAERGEQATAPDPEEAKADAAEVLARCTKGWSGFLGRDGEPLPFSTDAARELYLRFPVIREQADRFVSRRANFLPVSSEA